VSSDRFLISSDILFAVGSFALSPDGRQQIGLIARVISELEEKIPQGTQWIIRVDGHTDIQPVVLGNRGFRNNTELSLLRAQAVVNELVRAGVQQRRLIPSGFGELFPIAEDTDPASLQKNRRIELRLTNP
jgi:chemotaxis protein MotB